MRKLPRVEYWDCNCIPCRLVRAGVCLDCAVAVHEQALEHLGKPGLAKARLCSGSCYEAFQVYEADPTVWRARESKPGPLFGCGGKVRKSQIAEYEAARRGDIPTSRIGRLLRVPVVALERKLSSTSESS
jgi:hypothetical protein